MLYKVYAQNCRAAKRISKATEDDLNHVIDRVYDRASEAGLINDMTEDGEEIDNNDTTLDNQMFFKTYIQPDIEHMLNERQRSKRNRERSKQREN